MTFQLNNLLYYNYTVNDRLIIHITQTLVGKQWVKS